MISEQERQESASKIVNGLLGISKNDKLDDLKKMRKEFYIELLQVYMYHSDEISESKRQVILDILFKDREISGYSLAQLQEEKLLWTQCIQDEQPILNQIWDWMVDMTSTSSSIPPTTNSTFVPSASDEPTSSFFETFSACFSTGDADEEVIHLEVEDKGRVNERTRLLLDETDDNTRPSFFTVQEEPLLSKR